MITWLYRLINYRTVVLHGDGGWTLRVWMHRKELPAEVQRLTKQFAGRGIILR